MVPPEQDAAAAVPGNPIGASSTRVAPRWLRAGFAWALTITLVALGLWGGRALWVRVRREPARVLATVRVDRGELVAVIDESGTLESAANTAVKCEVEALAGLVGGMSGLVSVSTSRSSARATGMSSNVMSAGATLARAGVGGGGGGAALGMPALGAGGLSAAVGAGASTSGVMARPSIRSFTYRVAPYVATRPRVSVAVAQREGRVDPSMLMGGRGAGLFSERPGSTRILRIVEEGTRVKAGDIVCELDRSAFERELTTQRFRHLQARAWVDQAQSNLEVSEISLREYVEVIFPQDLRLVKQYHASCLEEEERARKNVEWSRGVVARGFRSPNQLQADELALQQAEFRRRDAEHMATRLENYTGPRLERSLRAKVEAVRSDLLAQEAALQLEADRLERLEVAVAKCTLRAPHDGIAVYHNPPNSWGRVESSIQEGRTVRQGQTIIDLPDPRSMRVRVRINESKVAGISTGQKARVVVDAFPDRPLMGTVREITPIPAAAAGPISDVKIYFAVVDIQGEGFEGLRTGLSAHVTFLVEAPREVTRVPLEALRWLDGRPYAAVARADAETPPTKGASRSLAWQWRQLELGQSDPRFAEVVSGLQPGESVVVHPDQLPTPRLPREGRRSPTMAGSSSQTRG